MTTTRGGALARRWPAPRGAGHRRRVVTGLAIGVVLVVAGVITVVLLTGGTGQPGVLSNGSPPGDATDAGITVNPGMVADFGMTVENTGPAPVILESARLVPLPGFKTPVLVHLGVLDEHRNLLTASRGWPIPRGTSPASGTWAMDPLRGYVILPWDGGNNPHLQPMPDMIEYGMIGPKANTVYASAGLIITYRLNGSTYTQTVYNGGEACVLNIDIYSRAEPALQRKYCDAMDNRAMNEVYRVARGG
jgi:hypothetical protein